MSTNLSIANASDYFQKLIENNESSKIKIFSELKSILNQVPLALSQTFFSSNLNFGRWLFIATIIASPRVAVSGMLGLLLTLFFGSLLSNNKTLKNCGLFAMNGWFLGLSVATFYADHLTAGLVLLCLSALCPLIIIALDRVLRAWDLPQLVLSYVMCIWAIQLIAPFNLSLNFSAQLPVQLAEHQAWKQVLIGTVKGYGQIFFQDSVPFSIVVLAILARFKILPLWLLLLGPVFSTSVTFLIVGNHWVLTSGLASFTPILLGAAYQHGFVKPTQNQLLTLLAFSGLTELFAVQLASLIHIFALSAGYVGLVWFAKLITETEKLHDKEEPPSMPW